MAIVIGIFYTWTHFHSTFACQSLKNVLTFCWTARLAQSSFETCLHTYTCKADVYATHKVIS